MSNLKSGQSQLEKDFSNELKDQLYGIQSYSPDAKKKIQNLCRDPKFSSISSRSMGKMLNISKSTASRYKLGQKPKERNEYKTGPDGAIPDSFKASILQKLTERRKENLHVDLQIVQTTVQEIAQIHISLKTAERFLLSNKWRRRKTQVRHPMQVSPDRMELISNFLTRIQNVIQDNNIKPFQFHVMDESAILSNYIPSTTYISPEETEGYILGDPNPKRDSIILTLTADGGGHLFYVNHRERKVKNGDDGTKIIIDEGCRGVGNDEMVEWSKSFVKYAHPGDILLIRWIISMHTRILKSFGSSLTMELGYSIFQFDVQILFRFWIIVFLLY